MLIRYRVKMLLQMVSLFYAVHVVTKIVWLFLMTSALTTVVNMFKTNVLVYSQRYTSPAKPRLHAID